MIKSLSLLLLAIAAFGQSSSLTVTVEPTYLLYSISPDGKLSTTPQYGLAIHFCSTDPTTVAFIGEVSYQLNESNIAQYASVIAMANANHCGIGFVWVGKTSKAHAAGWEVTAMGQRADSHD